MTRITNRRGRKYSSQLRAEQAEETRARILDATVPVMARGIASLSIPAVAREAGVSVPTVYRHFATKQDLIEAIYPHVMRRATMANRVAVFRALADSVEPKLAEADRDRVARLLVVLIQSSSLRMWHDHLGLSVDEVADEVDWVVRAAIAAAQARKGR